MRAYDDPVWFAEKILGISLYPKQKEVLTRFYRGNFRELVLIAGMRSGKSFLASVIATYEAFRLLVLKSPQQRYGLSPTSPIHIIVVAASEEQARDALFSHIAGFVERTDFFQQHRPKLLKQEIVFQKKRVKIFCGSSSSATMVGRTAKAVIFDELARFEQTEGKRGAWMVYTSLKNATMTLPDGIRVIISSPLRSNDILMQLYEKGRHLPDVLALKYPTWEFNPNLPFEKLRSELERDPVAFWRDFGCEPSETLYPYFSRLDLIRFDDSRPNVLELIANGIPVSVPQGEYVLAGDPALKYDAFGWALAHWEGDVLVYDGVLQLKPPRGGELDPFAIRDFVDRVIRQVPVFDAVFDIHMYPELQRWLQLRGIRVRTHIVRKPDYDAFKEAAYQHRVILPHYEPLVREMRALQVVNETKVDHPRGGSKDVIDAVVNAYWLANQIRRTRRIALHLVSGF